MPEDQPTTPSTLWHEALRERDTAAHTAEDARTSLMAVEALELRLAQANAARHALTAAVQLRDRLLEEQRVALGERDALVQRLSSELEHERQFHRQLQSRPLWRRAAGYVRRRLFR